MAEHKPGDARSAKLRGPIMAAVDFSSCSEAALLLAGDLAAALASRLIVLHVVHDPANMPGYYQGKVRKKTLSRMEDLAGERLDTFLAEVRTKHPECQALQKAEVLLVKGLPVTRILEVAEKQKVGMVVIGSKGTTGLRPLLLGSVAAQVVSLAKRPVTVVREEQEH